MVIKRRDVNQGEMEVHLNLKFILFFWLLSIINSYETFSPPKNARLRQLAVDDVSGNIYVGADNLLCQLNADLDLMYNVDLGPIDDNHACIPKTSKINAGYCLNPVAQLSPTDNVVKILVIDQQQTALIVCGNVYQGSCQMRNLQNIEELINFPTSPGHWVVANKGDNASFGFIAAGPSGTNVLYVGASFAEAESALVILPSIAIRRIDKNNSEHLFKLYKDTVSENKRTLQRSRSRTAHVIFNGGFASGSYRYFSTVKPMTPGSPLYKSRLTRICQMDEGDYRNKKLISYMEAPLECKKDGVNYPLLQAIAIGHAGSELATSLKIVSYSDIVVGLFSQAKESTEKPAGNSAVCIYTIKEIELAFENKTRDCWAGNGYSGLSFDGQNNRPKCNVQSQSFSHCNVLSNSPLELDSPIEKMAAFILEDATMLSLKVVSHDKYTVAFVGTSKGTLLKLLLEGDKDVTQFAQAKVSDKKVEQLALSKDSNYVLAMAEDKLAQIPVAECDQYDRCSSCTQSNNPYCGWCVLKNRCSTQSECANSNQDIHWKRGKPNQCITITDISPQSAPANLPTQITLKVQAELPTAEVYECVFEKYGSTRATVEQSANNAVSTVTCDTPHVTTIEENSPIDLSLKASSNSEPFVTASQQLTIYDCTIIDTCQACNTVELNGNGCKWCPYDGGCIYQSYTCNKGHPVASPNVCPSLEYLTDVLIPAGIKKMFTLRGKHLPPPLTQPNQPEDQYYCVINIDGQKQTTTARLKDSSLLICEEKTYTYSGNKGTVKAEVSAIFANVEIDKPKGLSVDVYKCNLMAADCSQCQGGIDPKYKCSWCTASSQCMLETESCGSRLSPQERTCPPPKILSVFPSAGPLKGGTRVTITGRNLGVAFKDVESIYVAGESCNQNLFEADYVVSSRVVCETGYSSKVTSGPIRITVRGELTTSNAVTYRYVNPEITRIEPRMGPKSGGSLVTLSGKNLDIGTGATVVIGGVECKITEDRTPTSIVCMTSKAGSPKNSTVQLSVDRADIRTTDIYYRYIADPTISKISPMCSHMSGGIMVTVTGSNLHSVTSASMIAEPDNDKAASSEGKCEPSTDGGKTMRCRTPAVNLANIPDEGTPIPIGFRMDNTLVIRHMYDDENQIRGSLMYYPDFTVDKFDNNTTTWSTTSSPTTTDGTHYLRITGKHLTLRGAVNVEVFVGEKRCVVTESSTEKEIFCSPPTIQDMPAEGEEEDNLTEKRVKRKADYTVNKKDKKQDNRSFKVKVVLGNRVDSPGYLVYMGNAMEQQQASGDMPLPVVVGVVFAIIIMAVVVTLLIFKYRRNSQRHIEIEKTTKKQMQDLESQVARECKDAFTELQMLVMNDIVPAGGDMTSANLPFVNFSTYAIKVLFPHPDDYLNTNTRFHNAAPQNKDDLLDGLRDFQTLLLSDKFILTFIYTLEQQPKFNMKDRCNVASLLMVALHARLDYITYIMTRLLCNLMKRPQIKTSPQLFLRRTESIAEKFLTNWLTFCLYDYVKVNAGNQLFVLYRAIKTQIESGPVDMVTYEARYALSEDKLLRQKVEFVPLNVYLSVEGGKVPVKLLDCDTITQAKHKLQDAWYKGCAVSRRVSVDMLDLRLLGYNNDNGMTLSDDDGSNKCEGDWKRLNTLRHYKVCDGAVFSFRKIETPATNKFGHLLDGSSVHFNSNPKLNRSYDMNSSKMSRRGSGSSCEYRTWHLSKNTGCNSTIEGGETKFMPEIYLTRLLTTKGTLQTFVDDLFNSIFKLSNGDVPPAIKFLFDLLDRQAAENGITDPDIIHTWKNNSIPLRFWINIIKNPEMILDVEKTPIIDSFLSVVAQTYMDACSLSDHRFNPDTPSSKLLYAAELREYKQSVQKFYSDIQALPPVTDEKLYSSLPNTSKQSVHLNRDAALFDLAVYANTYCYQVDEALAANHYDELSKKFASVISHLQVFLIPST